MVTAKIGSNTINCFDGKYTKDDLKIWSSKGLIKCPVCGDKYTYNHGRVRRPYFKHINKECNTYGEPETDEHIKGKTKLYEWMLKQEGVTDVVLEGWIPETKQRPDIMFKIDGKQYVIEYQCTPIASEYYERHNLYEASGITDIWILGTDKYIEKHNSTTSFKEKEIEKRTSIYFDSKYGLLMFKKSIRSLKYPNCDYIGGEAELISKSKMPIEDCGFVMINIDLTEFKDGKFALQSTPMYLAREYNKSVRSNRARSMVHFEIRNEKEVNVIKNSRETSDIKVYTATEASKKLGISSARALNKILVDLGIYKSNKMYDLPYYNIYVGYGLTDDYVWLEKHLFISYNIYKNSPILNISIRWTDLGLEFLNKLINEKEVQVVDDVYSESFYKRIQSVNLNGYKY